MTKEEYQKDKAEKRISIYLAWEMYNDMRHDKPKVTMSEFTNLFPMWITSTGSNCEKYWEHFDKKFEIN
jgi:hypothetical protein